MMLFIAPVVLLFNSRSSLDFFAVYISRLELEIRGGTIIELEFWNIQTMTYLPPKQIR